MSTSQTNRALTHLRRLALRQGHGGVTDAQLLERFLARREDIAFEELVRRHGPMVLGVCRRVLGSPHDAADAFQATFLVLARRAASIVPRSGVGPWLYGVARRTAVKARSSAARRRRAEQEAARRQPQTAASADGGMDLRPLLDEELCRLPEKYRAPLVLCLLEGRARKEAAGLLGWSEGTLSGRLARAKERLGERLRRRGVTLTGAALAAAVAGSAAAAEVPASLAATTAEAAAALAWPAAANAVSPPVVALSEEVMKAMLTSKLKAAAGVLVLVVGIGLGAGAVTWRYGAAVQAATPAQADTGGKEMAAPEKEAKPHAYVIEPPDILLVKYVPRGTDEPVKIDGQRLVRPDGTIGLGQLGSVFVSGRTLEEARNAVAEHLARRLDGFDPKRLTVDVVAYNSKFFYVIVEDDDGGMQVHRFPITGNETVLDAVSQVDGLSAKALKKHVWIARPAPAGRPEQILSVDWGAITRRGLAATNYQLLPGDRVFIKSRGPSPAEGARGRDAVPGGGPDPARELEAAVLKAVRAARSPEEQRRVVEGLEVLTKRLREQLNQPDGSGRPESGRTDGP
jgi:RNA polymerase sigma factor (sigma-70 family)